MRMVPAALMGVMFLVTGLGVGWAQARYPESPQAANSGNPDTDRGGLEPYLTRDMQERQLKRLRAEHQKEVLTDTDRIIQLATAMKNEVDLGTKTMNTDVMKDAEEMNKLAKRVSERIKTQ